MGSVCSVGLRLFYTVGIYQGSVAFAMMWLLVFLYWVG